MVAIQFIVWIQLLHFIQIDSNIFAFLVKSSFVELKTSRRKVILSDGECSPVKFIIIFCYTTASCRSR